VAGSDYKGPNTSEHMRLTHMEDSPSQLPSPFSAMASPFGPASCFSHASASAAGGHSQVYIWPQVCENLVPLLSTFG
jgi:hypothetical protein